MAIRLASLFIELGVNADQLTAELTRTSAGVKNWSKDIAKATDVAKKSLLAVGAAGVAAGAGIAAIYVSNARTLDALAKTASKLGDTTENLKEFGIAAELSGVGVDSAQVALQRMTRRLAEAVQGTGEAQGAIKELGLDAAELVQQRPSQAFEQISSAMADIPLQADKVRLAMKFFDTEGVALVNVTTESLIQARDAVADFGGALTSIEVSQIEAADDALTLLGVGFDLMTDRLTAKLAPAVTGVGAALYDTAIQGDQLNSVMDSLIISTVTGLAAVTNGAAGILRFVEANTAVATYGVLGYALFGKKGLVLGAAIGAVQENLAEIADDIRLQYGGSADAVEVLADKIEGLRGRVNVLRKDSELPIVGRFLGGGLDEAIAELAAAEAAMAALVKDVPYAGLLNEDNPSIASATAAGLDSVTDALRNYLDTYGTLPDATANLIPPGSAPPGTSANDDTAGTAPPIIFDTASIYETQIEELNAINDRKKAAHDAYFSQSLAAQAQFQATWTVFEQAGAKDRFSILTNETSGALGALGKHSRKMFELNKAVGLANATIYIAEGMAASWKLGWPLGAVAAATVALNGAAQIQAINNAEFGQSKIATPITNADSSVGSGNVAQSTTTPTATESGNSIVVQIYPPIGASQDQIDEAINLAVERNIETGKMVPETEVVFNSRAIA